MTDAIDRSSTLQAVVDSSHAAPLDSRHAERV
jgi:hypothetical protein